MNLQELSSLFSTTVYLTDGPAKIEVLKIIHKEISSHIAPKPTIQDMGEIYTKEGYIPAIKEWRKVTGLGLKEAKDDIDNASKMLNWVDQRVGKTATICCEDDALHGKVCTIEEMKRGESFCYVHLIGTPSYETVRINTSWLTIH